MPYVSSTTVLRASTIPCAFTARAPPVALDVDIGSLSVTSQGIARAGLADSPAILMRHAFSQN